MDKHIGDCMIIILITSVITIAVFVGIGIYSYKKGYLDSQSSKHKATINMGPNEILIRVLVDDIKNNVFSPEVRRN